MFWYIVYIGQINCIISWYFTDWSVNYHQFAKSGRFIRSIKLEIFPVVVSIQWNDIYKQTRFFFIGHFIVFDYSNFMNDIFNFSLLLSISSRSILQKALSEERDRTFAKVKILFLNITL